MACASSVTTAAQPTDALDSKAFQSGVSGNAKFSKNPHINSSDFFKKINKELVARMNRQKKGK